MHKVGMSTSQIIKIYESVACFKQMPTPTHSDFSQQRQYSGLAQFASNRSHHSQ